MKEGQKLWWVSSNRYNKAQYVTITKVGRKWATLSNQHRIDKATLRADGGGYVSPGCCYLSKEQHDQEVRASSVFSELRNRLSFSPSHGVTEEDIRQAAKLLRIKLEESCPS